MLAWDDLADYEKVALAYCAPHGIPLSVFLGRVVYPGDPLWLPRDSDAAVCWLRVCTSCGQHLDETFGPAHEEKWNAEVSGHCDGCRALARAAAIKAGRDDIDQTAGSRFRVWRDEETG